MKTKQASFLIFKAAFLGYLLTGASTLAQESYLGTCDPKMGKGEFFRYECLRGDGSIGWMQGTRIGGGRPIMSIHNRNTPNAYMLIAVTNVFPGYFCYYEEGQPMNPSDKCKSWIQQEAQKEPEKISANCTTKVVIDHSLPAEFRSNTFPAEWMPGSSDGPINEAFRILCPTAFAMSGVKPPYKIEPLKTSIVKTPSKPKPKTQPQRMVAVGPRKDRDLGPAFTTTGLTRTMQRTKKYHQAVLPNMKSGRNMLGHNLVQMQVLSYEPGNNQHVSLWIQVNCTINDWKYLDNLAILAGGRVEMFGRVRTNEMGKWACNRFGFRY